MAQVASKRRHWKEREKESEENHAAKKLPKRELPTWKKKTYQERIMRLG